MQGVGIPGLGKGLVMGAVTQDSGGIDLQDKHGEMPRRGDQGPRLQRAL